MLRARPRLATYCVALTLLNVLGCNALPCVQIEDSHEFKTVERYKLALDERILVGMRAGVAELRRRGASLPADEDLPSSERLPSGELDPVVRKYAFDGDGQPRGEGADMISLEADIKRSLRHLKEAQAKSVLQRCIDGP